MASASAPNSATRRLFPMPASPITDARRARPDQAVWSASRSCPSAPDHGPLRAGHCPGGTDVLRKEIHRDGGVERARMLSGKPPLEDFPVERLRLCAGLGPQLALERAHADLVLAQCRRATSEL